jgi:hypothetical protein
MTRNDSELPLSCEYTQGDEKYTQALVLLPTLPPLKGDDFTCLSI